MRCPVVLGGVCVCFGGVCLSWTAWVVVPHQSIRDGIGELLYKRMMCGSVVYKDHTNGCFHSAADSSIICTFFLCGSVENR